MNGILLCCAILSGVSEAAKVPAPVVPVEEVQAERKGESLKTATVVFAVAASLDWGSTYQFLDAGTLQEVNPMLAWLKNQPVKTVAVGAAIDVAGVYLWNRTVGRKYPKLAKVGLFLAAVHRLFLAHQGFTRHRQVVAWNK